MKLAHQTNLTFHPKAPFHFDATMHKPSHFPSSDNEWAKGIYWITMRWQNQALGLTLRDRGSVSKPKVEVAVYTRKKPSREFLKSLKPELAWRFNFDSDLSEFSKRFKHDRVLGPVLRKWKGMRPVAANSLYETLVIYIVLQNATVRRSVQMLENLFSRFGTTLEYGGKKLSCFWAPEQMARASERELRSLKVGYRAKFLKRLSEQFAKGGIDEFAMRKMSNNEIEKEVLKLYGIGPASVEYILFEDFYRYNAFSTIPPWEQKILSMILFKKQLVPVKKIFQYAERWSSHKKLAIHYLWEDIFWKRKHKKIPWLEKEIRL